MSPDGLYWFVFGVLVGSFFSSRLVLAQVLGRFAVTRDKP